MENKKNLLVALAKFYEKKPRIIKNLTNPYYKSLYADINSVFYTVEPLLTEVGIMIIQAPIVINEKEYLNTKLVHIESGEYLEGNVRLFLPGPDMQKLGGAITYARRYGVVTMLNLEQEDDDGNNASRTTINVASDKQVQMLLDLLNQAGMSKEAFLKKYKLKNIEDIDKNLASEKIDVLLNLKKNGIPKEDK